MKFWSKFARHKAEPEKPQPEQAPKKPEPTPPTSPAAGEKIGNIQAKEAPQEELKMLPGDEFICGLCGKQSEWRQTYYQRYTPDGPGASLPKAGYRSMSAWYSIEHFRFFCPKCGGLIVDETSSGLVWTSGARPVMPGKVPSKRGGGECIYEFEEFLPCLVPRGSHKLDIRALEQAESSLRAKEEARRATTIPQLIAQLRASKGRMANALEMEIQSRGEEAVPYLIPALKDEEVYLRWRVCYVLAGMGKHARDARAALTEALQDSAESVRDGARAALSRIPQS
jgi:hypothetical protein